MIKFYVFSYAWLNKLEASDMLGNHIIISIRTPGDGPGEFATSERTKGVLRLEFWDDDRHNEEGNFSPSIAKKIWDFVQLHAKNVDDIILHCDMGHSRSPAVAAALARGLGQDDTEFFKRHRPNMRVYRVLINEIYGMTEHYGAS